MFNNLEPLEVTGARNLWVGENSHFGVNITFEKNKILLFSSYSNRRVISLPHYFLIQTVVKEVDANSSSITIYILNKEITYIMDKVQALKVKHYYELYNDELKEIINTKQAKVEKNANEIYELTSNITENFILLLEGSPLLIYNNFVKLHWNNSFIKYQEYELMEDVDVDSEQTLLNELANILVEDYSIDENYKSEVAWELVKRSANEFYSNQWESNYGYYIDNELPQCSNNSNSEEILDYYFEEIILCNEISTDGAMIYSLLSYHCLYKGYFDVSYFPAAYRYVVNAMINISEKIKKNNYRNKLKGNIKVTEYRYSINDVDIMDGNEFEHFVYEMFSKMGYLAELTKQTGDQGIDVIAKRNNIKIGIQAKCYSTNVGNSAIQEAVAGKNFYNCDKVIVVTNSYFTNSAIDLAQANDVILWDRSVLKEKILELY